MVQPWRELQGLCHRGQPQFVNKLRSFKIDFSESQQFEKLGPTLPPSQKLILKINMNGGMKCFLGLGSTRKRKTKGEWLGMEDNFPSSSLKDHNWPSGNSRSILCFSLFYMATRIDCISQGSELQGDQSEVRLMTHPTQLTGYRTPLSMK